MTPLKPDSIKNEIAEIRRRSAKEQKAHERRDEVTATIIQHLKTTGTFFKTPEGHFYFERGEAPKLLAIEQDSIDLAACLISGGIGSNGGWLRFLDFLIRSSNT